MTVFRASSIAFIIGSTICCADIAHAQINPNTQVNPNVKKYVPKDIKKVPTIRQQDITPARQREMNDRISRMVRERAKAEAEAKRRKAAMEAEERARAEQARRANMTISSEGRDCDDKDAGVHPGLPEVCDLKDNNCNGDVDEGVMLTVYPDLDGDMYGDGNRPINMCPIGKNLDGFALNGLDCNDNNAGTNPSAGNCGQGGQQ